MSDSCELAKPTETRRTGHVLLEAQNRRELSHQESKHDRRQQLCQLQAVEIQLVYVRKGIYVILTDK